MSPTSARRWIHHVVEGFENLPEAIADLYHGHPQAAGVL
jgi:hypothetical protein